MLIFEDIPHLIWKDNDRWFHWRHYYYESQYLILIFEQYLVVGQNFHWPSNRLIDFYYQILVLVFQHQNQLQQKANLYLLEIVQGS